MTSNASNPSRIFASRQQVTAALVRAAERARVIAEQTGTRLVVVTPQAQTPLTAPLKPKETP